MLYTIKYKKKTIIRDFKDIKEAINYITEKIKASAIIENIRTREHFEYIKI